jgi:hypothetical protein
MFRLFIVLLLVQFTASAQVSVAPVYKEKPNNVNAPSSVDMSYDDVLKSLKGSTTYFIVPKGVSEGDKTELSDKLKSVWNLTNKLEFITMENFIATDYRNQNVNFISMVGNQVKVNKNYWYSPYYLLSKNANPRGAQINYNVLAFWAPDNNKRYIHFGEIDLEYNAYTWFKKNGRNQKKMRTDLVNNVEYVGNWFNAYIVNSLAFMQDNLLKKERVGQDYRLAKKDQLSKLKKETLYIPNYVLETRRGYTKERDLLKSYKFPVQVISKEELNKKIMNSSEPIYYLISEAATDTEVISIFNSKTNELIYHDYIGNSIKLKAKHLAKISKAIGGS